MGMRETRTQEARRTRSGAAEVSCWSEFQQAALRARPRTPYRAGQCVLVAKASIFNSLPGADQLLEHGVLSLVDGGHASASDETRYFFGDDDGGTFKIAPEEAQGLLDRWGIRSRWPAIPTTVLESGMGGK
jgi:hypothetical protein